MVNKLDVMQSRLGSLRGFADLLFGPKDVVAVDVGSYAVKVVLLKREGASVELKSWGYLPLGSKSDAALDARKAVVVNALRGFFI